MPLREMSDDPKRAASLGREEAIQRVLEACHARFPAPDFQVDCDEKGIVWIKRADDNRSVGLQPWQFRNRSADEVFARVDGKLARD